MVNHLEDVIVYEKQDASQRKQLTPALGAKAAAPETRARERKSFMVDIGWKLILMIFAKKMRSLCNLETA